MKKLLSFLAAFALFSSLLWPLAALAAEPFPADEMPEYEIKFNTDINYWATHGLVWDPNDYDTPAFVVRLQYEHSAGYRIDYSQRAILEYAAPAGLLSWFSSDAKRDTTYRFGIEEHNGFYETYQYEQYGDRFTNSVSSTFRVRL